MGEYRVLLKESDSAGNHPKSVAILLVVAIGEEKHEQVDIEWRLHGDIAAAAFRTRGGIESTNGGLMRDVGQEHHDLALCVLVGPAFVIHDIGQYHPVLAAAVDVLEK